MTERDLIERLDARLAHVDAHMARADVVVEEIREEIRLSRESREERREAREDHQDLRLFIREQTALMQGAARSIERTGARLEEKFDLTLEAMARRLDDMGDQIRANTEATWRMLDRFPGNGGAAPAG